MGKFSKNILAGLSVLMQALVLLLLAVFHGTNAETDFLFLALSISATSQLIILMSFDQFIVYFNRIKIRGGMKNAISFYYKTFVLSASSGIVVAISVFLLLYFFINSEMMAFVGSGIMQGFLLALPAYAITALNDRFFNAEGEILKSYLLVFIPNVALLVGVSVWTYWQYLSIDIVGVVYLCFMWFGAVFSSFWIFRSNSFHFNCESCDMKSFVINSFLMRFGHNFYSVSFQLITNFVLLSFQEGALSLFNYAYRSIIALFTVAVGPSNRVYMFHLSKKAASEEISKFSNVAHIYLKESVSVYVFFLFLLMSLVFFLYYFDFQSSFNFNLMNYFILIGTIGVWQLIVIFESVFVGVLIASTKAKVFIFVNILFALFFLALTLLTARYESVVLFSLSGLTAQVLSYLMYKYYVETKLSGEEFVCTSQK